MRRGCVVDQCDAHAHAGTLLVIGHVGRRRNHQDFATIVDGRLRVGATIAAAWNECVCAFQSSIGIGAK